MSIYIHNCASTSLIDSLNSGILANIHLKPIFPLTEPDYKAYIPANQLRRMSKVIRMGVGTALKALGQEKVQGIIVGTGLGCYDNSIEFTKEYLFRPEGLLSPTSFIQSTDNTIAGQIGLITKNNCYNITYTHKGLSFEQALADASLLCTEINDKVLVGGVDQKIDLFEIKDHSLPYWLGEGASFFIISKKKENSLACLKAAEIKKLETTIENTVSIFLNENTLGLPDLILYGNSFLNKLPTPKTIMGVKCFNYSDTCGIYFTNSSFGLHLATEIVSNKEKNNDLQAKTILLINNFNDNDIGLQYICNINE